jgi:hypothetical protein
MSKLTDRKVARTFLLSPDTVDRLKAAAAEDVRSMNNAAEVALRAWLKERDRQPATVGLRTPAD